MKMYYVDYKIEGKMIVKANSEEEAYDNVKIPYEKARGAKIEYDFFDIVDCRKVE